MIESSSASRWPRWMSVGVIMAGLLHAETDAAPVPGGRFQDLAPLEPGSAGFHRLLPRDSGLAFTNRLSDDAAAANQIRLNGSGVALGDVNGDGACDVYCCGLESDNALFLNRGDGMFLRDDRSPVLACPGQDSTGAVLADVDGDGDLDLLVSGIGVGTRLFLNDGTGRFEERMDSGLFRRGGATSLALADVDGDGDLDLYVCVYRSQTMRSTGLTLLNRNGRRMVPPDQRELLEITPEGRILEQGEPDVLYLNDGTGRFEPVPWIRGAFLNADGRPLERVPYDWGLAAQFRDINGDGRPDLYVCNDFHSPDRFWINESEPGTVRFRAASELVLRHTPTFSMTVDFADFNRDGWDDFIVADMLSSDPVRRLMQLAASDPYEYRPGVYLDRPQFDRNALQINRRDGTFADTAWSAGVAATDWTWSVAALDVDLDGWEDLLCTTGHAFDTQDLDADARIQAAGPWTRESTPRKLLMYPRLTQPNRAFRNRAVRSDGTLRFEEISGAWGFDADGVSHGMALADLDGDGDLDVVVNNLNGPMHLYRNQATARRLAVRLRGEKGNAGGVGARVSMLGGAVPRQDQEVISGGRYLSGDDGLRVFAAGDAPTVTVDIQWRSGRTSRLERVPAHGILEVFERDSGSSPEQRKAPQVGLALMRETEGLLSHVHRAVNGDERLRQPSLPVSLSTLGPGVSWADLDDSGVDALVLSDGVGGGLRILRIGPEVRTTVWSAGDREITSTLPLGQDLVIGLAPSGNPEAPQVVRLRHSLPPAGHPLGIAVGPSAVGPMALADLDGDGDLDLFLGGRHLPGRWPESPVSSVYRNEDGDFVKFQDLDGVGMVSGALFSDLDGDGTPELVLAVEWGAPRVFRWRKGRLEPWDPPVVRADGHKEALPAAEVLGDLTGRWLSVAAGDFDGDGRMDLAFGNWGDNGPHARDESALYHGHLAGTSVVDVLEVARDPSRGIERPIRSLAALRAGWPQLEEWFPSFAAFNRAGAPAILSRSATPPRVLRARCAHSVVVLQRDGFFEVRALPAEAQWAPVFGISVADFDGDGREDLFLAQNFFGGDPFVARLDAGRGLLLLGDGGGGFRPLSTAQSGIAVWGEGRGAGVGDFNGDGRPDLCVAQAGARTLLFENVSGRPGLRVRLMGPEGNPTAVGASCRLIFADGPGPRREVRAGTGYWSCDSPTLLLGAPVSPLALEIRWPGGQVDRRGLPAGLNGGVRLEFRQ